MRIGESGGGQLAGGLDAFGEGAGIAGPLNAKAEGAGLPKKTPKRMAMESVLARNAL
jgi:hypothetical protein